MTALVHPLAGAIVPHGHLSPPANLTVAATLAAVGGVHAVASTAVLQLAAIAARLLLRLPLLAWLVLLRLSLLA